MKKLVAALTALSALVAVPAAARPLQCAPYAREHSAIDLYGNAATWWSQAQGLYDRGKAPRSGSVLVFKASGAMPVGHVAVVRKVVDSRHVMLDHANWSRPGMIETSALAEDVSPNGDWSSVRVWYAQTGSLGLRASPAFGFIYAPGAADTAPTGVAAAQHGAFEAAFSDLSVKG
ncbi:CHAP domain-containing protein [Novosphingobium naphthalenivorans]|uniref:CHAP domain-containing protein n=1 Tax=Novosphingobium naphthalenivorans TaxID=273168 RepID=UPI00082E8D2D|nr:CHAP domain-containing protein [Novosphingobium naphthalenivorans]